MIKNGSSDCMCLSLKAQSETGSQVLELQTFEECILNNFVLKDAFLHIGKLDGLVLCVMRELSNVASDYLDHMSVAVNSRCLSIIYELPSSE